MNTLNEINESNILPCIKTNSIAKSDIQKFIDRYEPSKFKILKKSVEIRSVGNLHGAVVKAAEVISDLSLELVVVQSAETAEYRAFEVREI